MIFNEEILLTLIKGCYESIVSDCAMSGRALTNHCLNALV